MSRPEPTMTTSNTSSELTLLGARLRVMTIARMVTVAALLLALAPVFRYAEGSSREVLVSSSIAYMALNAVVFVMLRRLPQSTRWLLDLSLLGDAAWATSVLFVTGQTTSGFIFLMYLQLVAGTVLFSWRTGLKLAIMHT